MKKEKITIRIRRPGFPITKIGVKKGITIKEITKDILHIENESLYVSINGEEKSLDFILNDNDLLSIFISTLNRADIKCNGNNWRIHINDKDNFPSDFHAHNIDTGEKLDLYSGRLYNPVTKKFLHIIHKKKLEKILLELRNREIKKLSPKAAAVLDLFDKSSKTA